jgi:hypothetical protein
LPIAANKNSSNHKIEDLGGKKRSSSATMFVNDDRYFKSNIPVKRITELSVKESVITLLVGYSLLVGSTFLPVPEDSVLGWIRFLIPYGLSIPIGLVLWHVVLQAKSQILKAMCMLAIFILFYMALTLFWPLYALNWIITAKGW